MRMVAPKLTGQHRVLAEERPEYSPLSIVEATNENYGVPKDGGHNTLIMAFRPTEEERQRLAAGEDVYIALLTFGRPMQPIGVMVGAEHAARCYGLEVDDAR